MALSGLLFAGLAVFMVRDALLNDRGLLIDRMIELGPSAATGFYWLVAMACTIFVLAALFGLVRSFGPPREVVLGPTAIIAPRNGLRHEPVAVPYATIEELELMTVRSQRFVTIRYPGGRISLAHGMLPAPADFDRLVAELGARVRAARRRG